MADDRLAGEMRWWGWGDAAHPPSLTAQMLERLGATIGVADRPRPPVALESVALPASRLGGDVLARLAAIVGSDAVSAEHRPRVLHAAGKGYPDLVRMRSGRPDGAPDAVVSAGDHSQVRGVLELCATSSLAVVPFGGGTSVVGGLAPLRGEHAGVISLDLGRMSAVLELDGESSTVNVQGGIRAPALERELGARGLTLGHFPQSYEYVSLGGCAATRSAGQASTGYGAIEEMVLGMRLATPSGEIELPAIPASAAGPSLRQLIIGSEGTLGVISELSLRVRRLPQHSSFEGLFFQSFADGAEALRTLAAEHALPDVARLSDESETALSLASGTGLKGAAAGAYLKLRGYDGGCIAIVGFDGEREELERRRSRSLAIMRRHGAISLGRAPGRAWLKGRFAAPYLRDELLTHGVMVETLETAAQWSNVAALHRDVAAAIHAALGVPALVMCHISHVYETGCSLYFTFLARQRAGGEIEQWRQVKDAASRAILDGGGTITHHHAVGVDHARWLRRELGEEGVRALVALKQELDPAWIMNPGKLLPGPTPPA